MVSGEAPRVCGAEFGNRLSRTTMTTATTVINTPGSTHPTMPKPSNAGAARICSPYNSYK